MSLPARRSSCPCDERIGGVDSARDTHGTRHGDALVMFGPPSDWPHGPDAAALPIPPSLPGGVPWPRISICDPVS